MPAPARRGGRARRAGALAARYAAPAPAGDLSVLGYRESKFQKLITDYADELDARLQRQYPGVPGMRLLWHHETDSRRTRPGWLDLFFGGPGGVLSAELKTEARRTATTPEQELWLDVLGLNGFPAFVWTPADWTAGAIQNELQRLSRPRATPVRAGPPAPVTRLCGCLVGELHTCKTWGGLPS